MKEQKMSLNTKMKLFFKEIIKGQIFENFKDERNHEKKTEFIRRIFGSLAKRNKYITSRLPEEQL